jgi:hypothetical protein
VPRKPRTARALCRHCQRRVANRPRGLCWTCYYTASVSEQYDSESIYGNRGVGFGPRVQTARPTQYLPGTEGKVAELERRAKANMHLFHDQDALADE